MHARQAQGLRALMDRETGGAARETETFKSTFSCPSGCDSECPEGCDWYTEDYYRCECDNDAISTEAECERKNTWFLIYVSILLAIRVSNA